MPPAKKKNGGANYHAQMNHYRLATKGNQAKEGEGVVLGTRLPLILLMSN